MPSDMRLQKYLSQCGVASRRAAEEMIVNGEVTVNGKRVTELGTKVDPARDKVRARGKDVSLPTERVHYAYYKPRGLVVTHRDEKGRDTIFDHMPESERRLIAVGRLDLDSEGLLLLTDDGEWAQKIAHPSSGIQKEYHVLVSGNVAPAVLRLMTQGVEVERGQFLKCDEAEKLASHNHQTLLRIILHEGRKRHIRLLLDSLGFKVLSLLRVRIGDVTLGHLKTGRMRKLTPQEINSLTGKAELEQ